MEPRNQSWLVNENAVVRHEEVIDRKVSDLIPNHLATFNMEGTNWEESERTQNLEGEDGSPRTGGRHNRNQGGDDAGGGSNHEHGNDNWDDDDEEEDDHRSTDRDEVDGAKGEGARFHPADNLFDLDQYLGTWKRDALGIAKLKDSPDADGVDEEGEEFTFSSADLTDPEIEKLFTLLRRLNLKSAMRGRQRACLVRIVFLEFQDCQAFFDHIHEYDHPFLDPGFCFATPAKRNLPVEEGPSWSYRYQPYRRPRGADLWPNYPYASDTVVDAVEIAVEVTFPRWYLSQIIDRLSKALYGP